MLVIRSSTFIRTILTHDNLVTQMTQDWSGSRKLSWATSRSYTRTIFWARKHCCLGTYNNIKRNVHQVSADWKKFFILTRKFFSNPIEALFGFLRKTAGCNDAMDMRSVFCRIEKILKTGIISSSLQSNMNDSTLFWATTVVSSVTTGSNNTPENNFFPVAAINRLREICTRSNHWLPNPEITTLALIEGDLARVMTGKLKCQGCIAAVEKPKGNTPVDELIAYQDRGALKHPTKQLVTL